MTPWFKKSLLVFATVLMLEGILQIACLISPKLDYLFMRKQARWIADAQLGSRPNPNYPEHDKNGFRNKTVPDETCLVALGDSQTYGWKVQAFQAWPQQVGSIGDIGIYNMAVPKYGPIHSLLLWPEVRKRKPKIVIEGFYSGNDLFDSYNMVYLKGRVQQLRTSDSALLKRITEAGTQFNFQLKQTNDETKEDDKAGTGNFIAEKSKLYGLVRALRRSYYYNYVMVDRDIYFANDWHRIKELAAHDSDMLVFDDGAAKTVFTVNSRAAAMDLQDERIAEGLRISCRVFEMMNRMANEDRIRFVVLLIPTKELVFKERVFKHAAQISPAYRSLVDREDRVWAETKDFLTAHGIAFIDALPELQKAVDSGPQPYSISANSHMNSIGHKLVANLVNQVLKRDYETALQSCKSL